MPFREKYWLGLAEDKIAVHGWSESTVLFLSVSSSVPPACGQPCFACLFQIRRREDVPDHLFAGRANALHIFSENTTPPLATEL